MGSSKTPKVEVPEETRIQAERGLNRYNERILDGYTRLEADAIRDADVNRAGLIGGRGSADLALMERQGYNQLAANPSGLNVVDFQRLGDGVNASVSNVRNVAQQQARHMQDAQKLGLVHTGADIAKSSDSALNSLSRNALSRAFIDTQNEVLRSNAKFSAAMNAAQGAATGIARRKSVNDRILDEAGQMTTHGVVR